MPSPVSDAVKTLSESVELPSGVVLPNRICKAPMEEGMARWGGSAPTPKHLKLYSEWAKGRFGLLITGNVDVDPSHIGTMFDIVSSENPSEEDREVWRQYAKACKSHNTPTVVQLVHPGRQAMRGIGGPWLKGPLAPSPVRMQAGTNFVADLLSRLVFALPRQMTKKHIEDAKDHFVRAAVLSRDSGFDGVELHAAHGYLLAQFLSPNTNRRKDDYGGSAYNRIRILLELVERVRRECPRPFILGVKLNSADYTSGGLTEEDALQHVQWLQETGEIDFIEVSGGTYENGGFMRDETSHRKSTSDREAFFAKFAAQAKDAVLQGSSPDKKPAAIIVTGGLRTRKGMAAAVSDGAADLVGLGRPSAVAPHLPLLLLDPNVPDDEATAPKYTIKGTELYRLLVPVRAVGAGFAFIWHCCQMRRVASGKDVDLELSFLGALFGGSGQGILPALWAAVVPLVTVIALGAVYLLR